MTPFPLDGGRAGDGGARRHLAGAVTRARRLRLDSTHAERLLWAELRKLRLNFRRQCPIGRYITDFAHHAGKLITEIDGPVHDTSEAIASDAKRTRWLQDQGYRVIRFRDLEVVNDLARVVKAIEAAAGPPSPALPPRGGKGED